MTETTYTGVQTLEGLAGMRAKPAMYLGSTGVLQKGHAPRALTQMGQEVISNSLDEALAGFGRNVKIIVDTDNSMTVIDEGRGLPKGPDDSFDDVIRAATAPHTSGKFDDDSYAGQNTTGTHGIGIKATNAISTKMIIEAICYSTSMKKDQKTLDGGMVHYIVEFEQDKILSAKEIDRWSKKDLDSLEEQEKPKTGTIVKFWPDPTILESIEWTNNDLEARFEASAFLFPGVTIKYEDQRSDYKKEWKYDDGLSGYIKKMSKGEMILSKLKEPISIDQTSEVDNYTFKISAAITFTEDANETTATYANGVPTKEGGPHQDGFYAGLVKAVNEFAIDKRLIKQSFRQSDVTEGLIAALHVQVPSKIMEFEGQTKEKLATVQAKTATQQAIFKAVSDWMYDHLDAATQIVEKTEMARQAREAAAKSRKEAKVGKDAKKKKRLEISSKLKQAASKDRSKCELLITEGDSASNVKRDKMTQAILGIRGKIKNAFELSLSEAVKNQEISTIIGAIGAGVGADCDPNKSNYGAGVLLACFDGATKVKSLDGNSYSFKELVDNEVKDLWVYSIDQNGNVIPSRATNIRKTGKRSQMIKLTLDNDEIIESTLDHSFMNAEGQYIEAKDLKVGDSLMPLHTRVNDQGYEEFYDSNRSRYELTYRRVAETILDKERTLAYKRLDIEEHLPNQNGIRVHHNDFSKTNNSPENLEWVTIKEHWQIHGADGSKFTEYNQSESKRERLKELHKSGKYSNTYVSSNNFNGSNDQKSKLSAAHSRGVYKKKNYEKLAEYNRSQKHREVVAKTNASKKHIDSVKKSKILMSVRFLIDNNLPFDEYHYNYYRNRTAAKFDKIFEVFKDEKDLIKEAKNFAPQEFEHAKDYMFEYDSNKKHKNQIAKVVKKMIENDIEITEENYNQLKGSRTMKFDRALEKFESFEQMIEYSLNYNHKIIAIEVIDYDEEKDVYCMTVDKYHNFLLDAGIFVKNCDADDDGAHIRILLIGLFYRFMRKLIEDGMLYVIVPPLYKAEKYIKGKPEIKMYFTEQELAADRNNLNGYSIQRYKGLGEMDKETEAYDAITNPKTRRVVQVTIEDALRASQIMKVLLGNDASLRAEWIKRTIDFEELSYD